MSPSFDDISRVVTDLKRVGGVRAVAVVSREGILIASDMPSDVHAETFAAMAAVMLCAAEAATLELERAVPDRLIVETDEGKLFIMGAGERSMLVVLTETRSGAGQIIVEMGRAVNRVQEILGGKSGKPSPHRT
ncbi:MAG TPA: roadblock/LC7 domain-containing protein [Methanocella sp.]|nr:roadblock/LC7 domain-containing protein [Methanocella sp.]